MTQDHVEFITSVIGTLSLKLAVPCSQVYRSIKNSGLIQTYLVPCYDVLHTFSLDYVADDIINYMNVKGITI